MKSVPHSFPWQRPEKTRLQRTQEEVEEVKVIMLDNMNKADERAGKLSDLDDRAEELLKQVRSRRRRRPAVCEGMSAVENPALRPGLQGGNVILSSINKAEAELDRKTNVQFTSCRCFMALCLERHFLLFSKMSAASWSPWHGGLPRGRRPSGGRAVPTSPRPAAMTRRAQAA
uniref:V-SNARE coiled-coil homology domain-containing protein n=1 Tax=Salarias fasciatus TaxID=181472 RepID=A0A672JFP6_SALFA